MQTCGAYFGFFLALALKWTVVSLHPLGLDVGIHPRQPNYLPTYNGIFSIHALNYSSSTADTLAQQFLTNTTLTEGQEDEEHILNDQSTKLSDEDGTAANEVDSEDRLNIEDHQDQTTFPQLHVVSQTINDISTVEQEGTTIEMDNETTNQNETLTEEINTDAESLLEGAEDNEDEPNSEDLFDRLMRTIQGHWLEFVGKMKMSVLDVWKSISRHMMERLESFATGV